MNKAPVVSIVIVSYNCCDLLERCLASLAPGAGGVVVETIVVDNASADGTAEMVSGRFPGVRYIRNSVNAGFAAANNQGIRITSGKYILLLNPDTEVLEGAVPGVAKFLDAHPRAWVAGCRLRNANGTVQYSVGAFPSIFQAFVVSSFMYLLLPKTAVIGKRSVRMIDYGRAARVDCVMGAFFMVRREAILSIGELDERFFMYSEEVDFCRRVHDAGFEVWFTPDGDVTHFWGGMNAISRRGIQWLVASQILYVRKHHHGIEQFILIFLKYAGLVVRVIVYALAGVVTANRDLLAKSTYFGAALRRLLSSPSSSVWDVA